MLLNFTDDMEIISDGDLVYTFYKKVIANGEKENFKHLFDTFSLHMLIQHAKKEKLFIKQMEEYLNEK